MRLPNYRAKHTAVSSVQNTKPCSLFVW
jgi:hypothetical protein